MSGRKILKGLKKTKSKWGVEGESQSFELQGLSFDASWQMADDCNVLVDELSQYGSDTVWPVYERRCEKWELDGRDSSFRYEISDPWVGCRVRHEGIYEAVPSVLYRVGLYLSGSWEDTGKLRKDDKWANYKMVATFTDGREVAQEGNCLRCVMSPYFCRAVELVRSELDRNSELWSLRMPDTIWWNEGMGLKRYCLVRIVDIDKCYWYYSDFDGVEVDSDVRVPFGKNNADRWGKVEEVRMLSPSEAPIADGKIKKIKDVEWIMDECP